MSYTIELFAAEDSLTWRYWVRNDGTTRLAVPNGPDRAAPEEDPPVWVVNAGGGTVEVSQRLHNLPEGVLAAEPFYVGGSILEPGESLTSRATVALPLRLHYPYAGAADESYAPPDDPVNVVFCLGVLELSPDWDDSWWFTHDEMALEQHLLCSEPELLR